MARQTWTCCPYHLINFLRTLGSLTLCPTSHQGDPMGRIEPLPGPVTYRGLPFEDLIERSSLGTPEVAAARARTPLWVRYEILARLLRPDVEEGF